MESTQWESHVDIDLRHYDVRPLSGLQRTGRRLRSLLLLIALTLLGSLIVDASPDSAEAAMPLTLNGHGYGHGRGMGQWGAYGYALNYAWSHTTILSHYYGGTSLGTEPNSTISVRLYAQDGRDLVISSGRPFTVGGILVAGGSAARLSIRSDGKFLLNTRYACGGADVWSTVISSSRVQSTVADSGNDLNAMLSLCLPTETRQYRGEMALVNDGGSSRTVNTVFMDEYLRGVVPSEVPASWSDGGGGLGANAVRAQAVAARSYAYAENRSSYAKTCDTTSCQVYSGAGRNGASLEDPRTTAAITATYNQVLRGSNGSIVRTEFSSSTGGYSAGGAFPAVRDDGDVVSPYHNWVASFSATEAGSALGVGTLLDFDVTSRNGLGAEGGRVLSVRVSGTSGTVQLTGSDVRTRLGLKSDWFTPTGMCDNPALYARSTNTSGVATEVIPYGDCGDILLRCDWDGNGSDTPGVFRNGTWFLSNDNVTAERVFGFGNATDQPICGDWDGDGVDSVGAYRSGTVYLRNANSAGPASGSFTFGTAGDIAVTGNWNADAYDTLGVYRAGEFFLTNNNLRPATDVRLYLGAAGDQPIAGDWDGDGTGGVGVFRAGMFYLRNVLMSGPHDLAVAFGDAGDRAVPGDLTGREVDTVGIARGY